MYYVYVMLKTRTSINLLKSQFLYKIARIEQKTWKTKAEYVGNISDSRYDSHIIQS